MLKTDISNGLRLSRNQSYKNQSENINTADEYSRRSAQMFMFAEVFQRPCMPPNILSK